MSALDDYKASLIEKNRDEYGPDYSSITFVSPAEAERLLTIRRRLVEEIASYAQFGYRQTKVDVAKLSRGCTCCAEGMWSCLFINGACNAHCIYCPSRQDEVGMPTTNTLPFPSSDDYAAYIEEFGFTGVSLSGGEPLLTFARSLEFLTRLKRQFGDRVYFWLYTNGLLFTGDRAQQLRDAGLDEIRFDIGATAYRMDFVRQAVGIIPTVTVEIPALPDKLALLRKKLVEMKDDGVDFLHLHQLRLTPHNHRRLLRRGYTFVHGEKVTLPASEIAALKLIKHNFEHKIGLPINYCSFVYKNRFQGAGARKRAASAVCKPWEGVTENGYIRIIEIMADQTALQNILARLDQDIRTGWKYDAAARRLWLAAPILDLVDGEPVALSLSYAEASMRSSPSFHHPFVERTLSGRSIAIERRIVAKELALSLSDWRLLSSNAIAPERLHRDRELFMAHRHECIPAGLADYY